MAKEETDFLTQLRRQAERTLAILTSEVRKREAELESLLEQLRLWRDALAASFAPAFTRAARPPGATPRRATRQRSAGRTRRPKKKTAAASKKRVARTRLDWDEVLARLPATFTIDDVMAVPAARARGRSRIQPVIQRWVKSKKARRVGKGRYKRVG